jgi:Amt family ammonium transporter
MALEAGFVRAKNSINVVMKNVVDIVIVAIVFLLIGFPLMFGPTFHGWFGKGNRRRSLCPGLLGARREVED